MLTDRCIGERVQRAFEPRRGEAVISAYGNRVIISVYDGISHKPVLKPAAFRRDILRNESHLDHVLTDIKGQIPSISTS